MAEMGGQAGGGAGQHQYSTLEVVPTQDYGRVAFNKNDKEAFVPRHEHDKLVVPPQPDDAAHYDAANSGPWPPQTTFMQSGSAWDGGAAAAGRDAGTGKRERILGLKRWIFFVVLGVVALCLVAIGVGIGVGVSTRSRSNAEAEAAASSSPSGSAPSSVQSTTTATSASRTSASPSRTSSAPQSTASRQIGGPAGRCSDGWGSDCICLDETICSLAWNGTAKTGHQPDWPCPNDANNIKGCFVQPCKNASTPSSRCSWSDGCAEPDLGNGTRPICPGGDDFICCSKLRDV